MGGSDQWGNITTGTELVRRKSSGEAFALTCPLITKADGGKFGKTESGNIWLDPKKTSPYAFYQFWMNISDEDAAKYIKIFTLLTEQEVNAVIEEHQLAPHQRLLQNTLAAHITTMVHSEEALQSAIDASQILFGKGTAESLKKLDEETFLSVFEGVPQSEITKEDLALPPLDLLADRSGIFASKGEARRMIKENAIAVNQNKIKEDYDFSQAELLNGKYILIQKGKKKYFILRLV
jgi:tyrosyl-tRNA synthetase